MIIICWSEEDTRLHFVIERRFFMSKKLLLIVNPVAGIRRGNNILLDIVSTFCEQGYECTTQITTLDTRATELVKRYGVDKDTIVCVGGDGTFNETIAGCIELGIQPMIGYIPSGTTNDFASSLDLSLRPKMAVKNIAKRNIGWVISTVCSVQEPRRPRVSKQNAVWHIWKEINEDAKTL
jgi:diacylglycerol kinase family enzyme